MEDVSNHLVCPDLVGQPIGIEQKLIGSVWAVGTGKDRDYIWRVSDKKTAALALTAKGYSCEVDDYADTPFLSFRKGDVNILVITDRVVYNAYAKAADVCRGLRLEDKEQRILVHDILLGKRQYLLDTLI